MRPTFAQFIQKRENYGGSANDPSNVEDEGDGLDGVMRRREQPAGNPAGQALDGSDLPITKKNKLNFMKKCNCRQNKK